LVNDVPPKDRDIAMVFQNYALYPHMSVFENMSFALKLRKTPRDVIEQKVKKAAKILGIEQLLDRKPKTLSGGQRQRVALGRAIVRDPKCFLFDEPLSNLDAKLRGEMRAEIKRLHLDLKSTTIYVTHDQEEAMRLSQRIAIFSHGKIVGLGSGYDLYQNPPNAFVASFLGNSNFLKLKAQGNAVASFEGQSLSIRLTAGLQTDQDVLLMVRPEKALALSVEQASQEPLAAGWNEVSAKVVEVLFLGESQTCSVVTSGGTSMTVKALSAAGMPLKAGDPVRVRWATADACVYTEWAESDLNKAAGAH
jgi:putative spermidine/putrescine transport system ATP-binding protein